MTMQDIAAALARAQGVLERRPEAGMHDDAGAVARWEGDLRVVASHANGSQAGTDMPSELGGGGTRVTPGWLFRAGIASCATTSIAMLAASEGLALDELEVRVESSSDARGLFGLKDEHGVRVPSASCNLRLAVRIRAEGAPPARLEALVEESLRRSPIPNAVEKATAIAVRVDTGAD
jgi:uncharacterized OsmC-like protein